MAIIVDKDGNVVTVENQPEAERELFPNIKEGGDVADVLINGTSIVDENGDADIPIATYQVPGVSKVGSGLYIASGGDLRTNSATQAIIKNGADDYRPIVASNQYSAAFYGLAKAAGDATQAESDNVVGNYTDQAKIAIQKMLGIYEAPWELIREDSFTNETEADYTIDADSNNSPFELTDVYLEVWLEATTQQAAVASPGRMDFYYDETRYITQYLGSTSVEVGDGAKGGCVLITASKGAIIRENTSYKATGVAHNPLGVPGQVDTNRSLLVAFNNLFNKIVVKTVTGKMSYRLYGKRKWQ